MAEENRSNREEPAISDDTEADWKDIAFQQESGTKPVHLDVKDYVALFIASLETIFLPLVILAIMLLVLGFVFTHV
jgi:hypothetical protein